MSEGIKVLLISASILVLTALALPEKVMVRARLKLVGFVGRIRSSLDITEKQNSESNKIDLLTQRINKLTKENKDLREQIYLQSLIPGEISDKYFLTKADIVSSPDHKEPSIIIMHPNKTYIKPGDAIILEDSLVGVIYETDGRYSKALLTTHTSFKCLVNIRAGDKSFRGLASGKQTTTSITLPFPSLKIEPFSPAYTAPTEIISIPHNLIVGQITKVKTLRSGEIEVLMEPVINYKTIQTVIIASRKPDATVTENSINGQQQHN